MSYHSPIEAIYGDMELKFENEVFKAIQSVNINVDREALIKALEYDRQQYDKGYADGIAEKCEFPLSFEELEDIKLTITENTSSAAINEHFAQECAEAASALTFLAANLLKLAQIERAEDPTDADADELARAIETAINESKQEIIDVFNYMWVTGYPLLVQEANYYSETKIIRWAERIANERN